MVTRAARAQRWLILYSLACYSVLGLALWNIRRPSAVLGLVFALLTLPASIGGLVIVGLYDAPVIAIAVGFLVIPPLNYAVLRRIVEVIRRRRRASTARGSTVLRIWRPW